MRNYDLVIIGSGPAGHTAAIEAAKRKIKTAIIEKDLKKFGGVCLNEGCIPLKGFLHYSTNIKDYTAIKTQVMARVEVIKKGLEARLRALGVDIIEGSAKFTSKNEIEVNSEKITAKNFIIAAGSGAKNIFKGASTSEKTFLLEAKPEKVLIIGGGVIGCEYATFFNNIGCGVTITEIMESILFGQDREAISTVAREFKKKKIRVFTKSEVKSVNSGEAELKTETGEVREPFDLIIEATGRSPETKELNISAAGVELDQKGFIKVNAKMQTTTNNIYAAGDCINSPMLAYTAYKEAETAVADIAGTKTEAIDYENMPLLVFSSPQSGSCGLTEEKAKEKIKNLKIHKYFFRAIGKAVVEGKEAGFLKLMVDADKDEIAGAVAVGEEIVDLMNELALTINCKIKTAKIKEIAHIHPSYSEIITEALKYG